MHLSSYLVSKVLKVTGAVVNNLIFCLMLIFCFLWEYKRNLVAFTTSPWVLRPFKNTKTQTLAFIAPPQKYIGTTGSKQMNKCKPLQLAFALGGCIMDLATQNDYVPLEIMTDCSKRSYFTHSVSSLWGYHVVFNCAGKGHASEACGPSASQGARGRNAKECPSWHMINLGTGDQSEAVHSLPSR